MSKIPKSMLGKMRHKQKDRGDDLYETPPEATLALLKAEVLPKVLWEPNCGPGAIARVLRAAGHEVLSTDLVDYHSPDQDYAGVNFIRPLRDLPEVDAIVMNPPYVHAYQCIVRGLEYAPKVYALLRLAFLESESRHTFFMSGKLARVHVFSNRLPLMHRHGWEGPKSTSTICFAWFVFDRECTGSPQLNWIKWEPLKESPAPN